MDVPNRAHEFHFVPHDTVIETRFPEPSCVPKATDSVASNPLDVLHHSSDLGVAGWLAVTGRVIASVDGLFITLVALLTALICFGYLGMQVQAALAPESNPKKRR